jgi:hypothetical protein
MSRAVVCGFPYERILYEVRDLCVCKLTLEYVYVTGDGEVIRHEITDQLKEFMINKVCAARYKAYRQGKVDEPTLFECLRACYTNAISVVTAEVHHFYSSSMRSLNESSTRNAIACCKKSTRN